MLYNFRSSAYFNLIYKQSVAAASQNTEHLITGHAPAAIALFARVAAKHLCGAQTLN